MNHGYCMSPCNGQLMLLNSLSLVIRLILPPPQIPHPFIRESIGVLLCPNPNQAQDAPGGYLEESYPRSFICPLKNKVWIRLGRLVSFRDGIFSGAMWFFFGVYYLGGGFIHPAYINLSFTFLSCGLFRGGPPVSLFTPKILLRTWSQITPAPPWA